MNDIEKASLVKFVNDNVLDVNYSPKVSCLLAKNFGYHKNFRFNGIGMLDAEDPEYYQDYVNKVLIGEVKNATQHQNFSNPMFKLLLTDMDDEMSFSVNDLINATYNPQDHSFKFKTGQFDWQTNKICYDEHLEYSFIGENNQVFTLNDIVNISKV